RDAPGQQDRPTAAHELGAPLRACGAGVGVGAGRRAASTGGGRCRRTPTVDVLLKPQGCDVRERQRKQHRHQRQ
ncbi:MAG: hypothetical protein ACK58T_13080, partial [Phycisphaerae bacterium]